MEETACAGLPALERVGGRGRLRGMRELDLLAVVVPQALLVDSRTAKCQKARFFEQVDAVFACLSCFGFSVHRDMRRVELDVGRDDGFGPVEEEERGEPG